MGAFALGSLVAACGDAAIRGLSEDELLSAGDLPVADANPSTGIGIGNVLTLDGCSSFELRELRDRVHVVFEARDIWTLGEVIYADTPEAVAAAYEDAVGQLTACLVDPEGPEGLVDVYTAYAKPVELPGTGDDAFAVVSGLYAIPTSFNPDYERYRDEEYVSDLYDDGVEQPFSRYATGIVKHNDRLVIVTASGRTAVQDLIESGSFATILETATNRLAE